VGVALPLLLQASIMSTNDEDQADDSFSDAKCSCKVPDCIISHVPKTRGVCIVLLWILLTHGLYDYSIFNLGGILSLGRFEKFPIYIVGLTQCIILLLSPLIGLIGEVLWTRYKILLLGTIIIAFPMLSSPIGLSALQLLPEDIKINIGSFAIAIALVPFQIGLAIFESNIIQFGTNQLLFASSDELSAFIHWSFWCMYLVPFIVVLLSCPFAQSSITTAPIFQLIMIIIAVVVVILPCTKRHLEIRRFNKMNPIKLIYGVLKYAVCHKYPVNQSAFTHNDEETYNRLNFAKRRFGGPFTTEEVEDVKTFGRITILLLSLFGFTLIDNTNILSVSLGNFQMDYKGQEQCFTSNFIGKLFVVVIVIPIYKLVLTPLLYKYLPNMIKRMFMGLVTVFLSLAMQSTMTVLLNITLNGDLAYNTDMCNLTNESTINNNLTVYLDKYTLAKSQYIIIIPQILNGFSLLLVYLTALEFILAQAPRSMQGLLIGLWYAFQSINVLLTTFLFTTDAGCSYISYIVRTGLAGLSILLYTIAACWYKGRQKQECSEIRQNLIIEEYTTRALDKQSLSSYGTNELLIESI
jgi:peptide/histidine transporter 3/4